MAGSSEAAPGHRPQSSGWLCVPTKSESGVCFTAAGGPAGARLEPGRHWPGGAAGPQAATAGCCFSSWSTRLVTKAPCSCGFYPLPSLLPCGEVRPSLDFQVSGKLGERRGGEEGSQARAHEGTQFQLHGQLPLPGCQELPGLLLPGPRLGRTSVGLNQAVGKLCLLPLTPCPVESALVLGSTGRGLAGVTTCNPSPSTVPHPHPQPCT